MIYFLVYSGVGFLIVIKSFVLLENYKIGGKLFLITKLSYCISFTTKDIDFNP